MKVSIVVAAATLLCIQTTSISAQEAASALPGADVASLLAHAQEHNPEFQAMRHEAEAARQRVESAGALADPVVRMELENVTNAGTDLRPAYLPPNVGSTKYTLAQPLPFWGKRDLKRDVASAEADQAQSRALLAWNELAAKLKTAHAQRYLVSESLRLTSEILDLMVRLGQIAQSRYAGGLAAQQDAIRAEVEQTSLQTELLALEADKHHFQVRINALLSRPAMAALAEPQALRRLPDTAKLDIAALEERLRQRNPQLAADAARERAADKGRELTYRNRYPDFQVGVVPTQMGGRVNTWGVMLEMNVPLQQSSRRAQEREAESMLAAAQARKQATVNQALAELAEHVSALESARRTEAALSSRLLPQAEVALQSAQAAYENGKADFATLLDAQRQIRKAKLDRLKAQVEAQMHLAEVERLIGEEL